MLTNRCDDGLAVQGGTPMTARGDDSLSCWFKTGRLFDIFSLQISSGGEPRLRRGGASAPLLALCHVV